MSLPNACGCYRMPSGPERARLESLGAENIQGACACLSASMLGSSFEGGEKKKSAKRICNGVIPADGKSKANTLMRCGAFVILYCCKVSRALHRTGA